MWPWQDERKNVVRGRGSFIEENNNAGSRCAECQPIYARINLNVRLFYGDNPNISAVHRPDLTDFDCYRHPDSHD